MFNFIYRLFFSFIILILMSSCSTEDHQKRQIRLQQWLEDNGKLKVLSTTSIIDDLIKQIGGEYVDTVVLIEGQLDPHSYQLVKGDDEKLSSAQVVFYNGLGLEHGPSLHHYLLQNPKAFGLGDWVDRQYPGSIVYVNGQKDPHVWMDVSLWAKTIPFIVQTLSLNDPEHASGYEMKGYQLQSEMEKVHLKAKSIMHQVPANKRFLVTSHDAFNYFARAYLSEDEEIESGNWGMRFAAPEGLAPESQLSTTDIKAIIAHLKHYQIHRIFPESNVSRDSIRKIVQAGQEEGLDVQIACCALYGDAMGPSGSEGETYLKMIIYNAQTLADHMDPEKHVKKEN